ncbi:hypothetical protein KR009_004728 [Drosophila setifemur]|nr:hypothetical protein KR009_004728 [Drosophila setifemur]
MSCKKDDEDTNLTILFRDWHLSIEEISSDDEESEHHLRPCKVPQMEADKSVNCDDKSNNFIFVVSDVSTVEVNLDSSSGSPDSVPNSLVHSISDSSDTCFLEAITIEETDVSLSSEASPLKMDTPRSRTKRRTDSERRDRDIKKFQKNANATSSPTIPKVVTRSGRAVRVRLDKKFDYSSSQPEEGEDELSVLSLESEDEDYQLDLTHEHPKWSARKHRRERSQSSQSSSSDSSSPSSQEAVSIIYLDLGQSVAIVRDEPLPDLSLEDDPELKTKVLKFLGLMPPRRRLYNPMESLDMDPEEERETEASSPAPRPLFISNSPAKQTTPSPKRTTPLGTLTTTWSSLKVSHLHPPTIEERQAKLYDDLVLQANASHMEAQTPDVVKEPIDLSGLPSEKLRANNCRRHKSSIGCLEQHPLFYRFVESLNRELYILFSV